MEPTLYAGDLIFINSGNYDLSTGDIVTVDYPTGVYTHRVVEIKEYHSGILVKTKGDANEYPDPGYIPSEKLIGKVGKVLELHKFYKPKIFTMAALLPVCIASIDLLNRLHLHYQRRCRRQEFKWRKKSPPLMSKISILLVLISLSYSTQALSYISGYSATGFNDRELAEVTLNSGEWLNVYINSCEVGQELLNIDSQGEDYCFIETIFPIIEQKIKVNTVSIIKLNDTDLAPPIPCDLTSTCFDDFDLDGDIDLKLGFSKVEFIAALIDHGFIGGDIVKITFFGYYNNGDAFKSSDILLLDKGGET